MMTPSEPITEKTKKVLGINLKLRFSTICPRRWARVDRLSLLSPAFLALKLI